MKKTIKMLFVAALAIASAACAREEVLEGGQTRGEARTFTCSFDEDAQTRTDITKQGKTVWSEGDKIFVTNGTEKDTLTVGSQFAGKRYFEFSTTLEGEIYVVYPCTAAKEVKDGKFTLEVPSEQNGQFGSANISCAVAKDRYVKMRNVTSVIRFNVDPDAAASVKVVAINSNGNNVAGTFSIDMTSGSPVVSTIEGNSYSAGVTVNVNGDHGNSLYATVIPGTYAAGLTMTALTVDLHNASESKTTVSEKEFKINAYYDLGSIGANLKPIAGEGTKGNPWQISTLSDFLALAYYVNDGHDMKGEYVKLMDNIKTVTTSVGYYDAAINEKKQFVGDFDGNGKTVTLGINQTAKRSCGLFGAIAEGANIHDVTVEGTVNSTFDDAAGVCGLVNAAAGAKITNCVNKANVKSTGNYIGGIAGWSDAGDISTLEFDNCVNEGSIAGKTRVGGVCGTLSNGTVINSRNSGNVIGDCSTGGIVGYGYGGKYGKTIKQCSNSGNITATETNGDVYYIWVDNGKVYNQFRSNWTNGTGGICGWAQNITISNCKNSGTMKAQNKVGGISGSCYWSSILNSENTGTIVATHWGVAGGVLGWGMTIANVHDCVNNGEVIGEKLEGTQGRWVGGIAGYIQVQIGKGSYSIERCTNNGTVAGDGQGVGGIVGYTHSYSNAPNRIELRNCTNTGKVTNKQGDTGGIVGWQYDFGSWTGIPVDNCKNTGDISAAYGVGGIIGYFNGRVTGSRTNLRNCENHGNILSTKTGNDDGAYAGGIVGRTNGLTTCGIYLWNCLNTGKVQYSDASFKNAYVGGIAGSICGEIWNCYNGGEVGLAGAETPESALVTVGALAGNLGNNKAHSSYYLVGSSVNPMGTSSKVKANDNVLSAAKDGTLSVSVKIGDKYYNNVVDALNANRGNQTFYYNWTTGPKFSLTGNVGIGDGLDLGNGGKL